MSVDLLISVIVPIYKGIEYIPHIIEQIENNAKKLNDRVELIFVNDYPETPIGLYVSEIIDIVIIQTDVNRGIHKARIAGLENSSGEFVLFFDQDDELKDDYLKSQVSNIGNNDASVCRLIHNEKYHYTDTFVFEKVITKEFMLNHWCPIVSPGQVLLRRSAIPKEWKKYALSINGSDDYFCWILMMIQERKFVLNNEVLFEHVVNGRNTSDNVDNMIASENQMIDYLENIYNDAYYYGIFERLRVSLKNIHEKICNTHNHAVEVINIWKRDFINKGELYEKLSIYKNNTIAIYGAGELGMELAKLLKTFGIEVNCFIDRNARFILSEIVCCTLEKCDSNIDLIIITVKDSSLYTTIKNKFGCDIITV